MTREPPPDVAAFFDREAATWDSAHGPGSPRAAAFAARGEYLRQICDTLGRPRALDIGCGTGRQLIDLADRIAGGVGIDLSPAMIARARENAAGLDGVEFQVGDVAALDPETLGRFDLIAFVGSLEHVRDPAAALGTAARLLAPGGALVVIMPHPWNPAVALARRADARRWGAPLRHVSPRGLAAMAEDIGLRMESLRGITDRTSGSPAAALARRRPVLAGVYAARFALA